jgi:uncharacterized protein YjbI with pentapeptide repeats
MADTEQLAKLEEGVEAWNKWRAAGHAAAPDLRGAAFQATDLSAANLRGADLRGAGFINANLFGASLREANLQGVDLSVAKRGLQTEQLAGADLTGATLPDELKKLYDSLENVNNISESARKLFLVVLAACLYSWLTIATTTDLNLITNRASSPLPIIQTSIPIVGFYWVAPLLLLCVYFYFHFYLQKLWEELGSLPAILPDGRPLHTKIDPWLLNDLVRAHLPRLNVNRPFLSYFQLWISVLLAWWIAPMTMFLFWGRYLPRHERTGTTFHVVLLMISVATALRFYRLAVATLRGAERKPLRWRGIVTSRGAYQVSAFAVVVGVLFGVASWGAIMGVPSNAPVFHVPLVRQRLGHWERTGPLTWVPRLMALFGYSPFADLTGADISQKKPTWSKNDRDLDSVVRAQLKGTNLRYAEASESFFAGAELYLADLSGSNLERADLHGSDLTEAHLNGADLSDANLTGANTNMSGAYLIDTYLFGANLSDANLSGAHLNKAHLGGADLRGAGLGGAYLNDADLVGADLSGTPIPADLRGAELVEADLMYSDFRPAENLNLETVKRALDWEKAFYDSGTLEALGLPPDHNAKLSERRRKEQELQQKQRTGQTAPKPIPTTQ